MDLETFINIYFGIAFAAIGSWAIIAEKNNKNHGYDDDRPKLTEKEKNELKQWATNQDNDTPF